MKSWIRPAVLLGVAGAMMLGSSFSFAETKLVQEGDRWKLVVDGQPFPVRGVGGSTQLGLAAEAGANSLRTWGVDELGTLLDQAHAAGMKVAVGIWLGHERHGFDYTNVQQVHEQYERARVAIETYRHHPAVLLWSIGNEMEGFGEGDNAAIWSAVNNIAALAKRLDPTRPTMTVIAEVGGSRVAAIHKLCPDIDIVGINSYAGASSLPERYRKAGGRKPYLVTEFGPPGTWEVGKTSFGAIIEPTSSAKGGYYRAAVQAFSADPLNLGHYAFLWGYKQEGTATWFGMLLPDGSRLAAVDVMQEIWTGKAAENRVPVVEPIVLSASDRSKPGATMTATVVATDPENDPLTFKWELHLEPEEVKLGGDKEEAPPVFPEAILKAEGATAEIRLPETPGVYRLFVFVRDGKGGAAVATTPILAEGVRPAAAAGARGPSVKLPVVVFADNAEPTWIPSGWMGNIAAIRATPDHAENPRSGARSFRFDYLANDGFGAIAWQFPANDWGDEPGSINVTGATKLTFYARGQEGGERVEFKFGILDRSKRYPDSASGGIAVTLAREWKRYEIDVSGLDLSSIKTGFVWSVAGQGRPITFFLDDIQFE